MPLHPPTAPLAAPAPEPAWRARAGAARWPPLAALVLATLGASAGAETREAPADVDPPADGGLTYAVGGALIVAPTYAGSSGTEVKPRPLWALRYGRFRLSGARSSSLLARPGDHGSGASADLIDAPGWRLGSSLRIDSGRQPGDDPVLAGLPEVRRTLRGRVYASVDFARRWTASVGYGHDLLGRGGGGTAGLGLSYALPEVSGVRSSLSLGATLADRQYMQTYYGISPAVAAATGRPAYRPGAGLMDLDLLLNARTQLAGRWTLIGGLGLTRLQGDAAASPLTTRRSGLTATLALAWRSR